MGWPDAPSMPRVLSDGQSTGTKRPTGREQGRSLTARWLQCLLPAAWLMLAAAPAVRCAPVGTLIEASERLDHVYDDLRDVVYITNGSQIIRYQVGTQTYLTPFDCPGAALAGCDLSPDRRYLIACDRNCSSDSAWIRVVDLVTSTVRRVEFPRLWSESGTWAVAFGYTGSAVITGRFAGSGWVQMRLYDPATGTMQLLPSVRQDTMANASADGTIIGLAESNTSGGSWDRYRVSDGDLRNVGNTSAFNFEIGVNRNATQYAVPTYFGTYVYDSAYNVIATVGSYGQSLPIGVAYHPTRDLVYFPFTGTSLVRVYRTSDVSPVAAYDFGHQFGWISNHAFAQGRIKVGRDGEYIFCTVAGGVRYVSATAPTPPSSLLVDRPLPEPDEDVTATATGSWDPQGLPIQYIYEWSRLPAAPGAARLAGAGDGSYVGRVLPAGLLVYGDVWQVRARASDGQGMSDWMEGPTVTLASPPAPTPPTVVRIAPVAPTTRDDLLAEAEGGQNADGSTPVYLFQWSVLRVGASQWSAWEDRPTAIIAASDTAEGEQWKVRACASNGVTQSAWVECPQPVTIAPAPAAVIHETGVEYATIQEAIDAASSGQNVVVQPGIWHERINFNGKAITVRSADPDDAATAAATAINGDSGGSVVTFNTGEGRASILSGLTITGGSGTDTGYGVAGGGVFCWNTSPTIRKCLLTGNAAPYGAGLYAANKSPLVEHNSIACNTATNGGGLYASYATPEIAGNTIEGNEAAYGAGIGLGYSNATVIGNTIHDNDASTHGGGVYCQQGTNTITGNTITDNTATINGGGIAVWDGTPSISQNTISGNSADGGGGCYCHGEAPVLAGNLFAGNAANYGGAIACESASAPVISNNVIRQNTATVHGGGIHSNTAAPSISANVLVANTASGNGGGIYCYQGSPTVLGNTLSGNEASSGGGVYCYGAAAVAVTNCVIVNSTGGGVGRDAAAQAPVVQYCDVWSNTGGDYGAGITAGTGCISADPLFADAAGGDFHLKSQGGHWTSGGWVLDAATSPCIDAGDPASDFSKEPSPNGGRVNMGAYGNTTQASRSTFSLATDMAPGTWLMGLPLTPWDADASHVYATTNAMGWQGDTQTYSLYQSQPFSVVAGYGYWAKYDAPQTLQVTGLPASGPVTCEVSLGWNLLGNPYQTSMAWSQVVGNGLLQPFAWRQSADGTSYELVSDVQGLNAAHEIPAWRGLWVWADAAGEVSLGVPTATEAHAAAQPSATWSLRLLASVGSATTGASFIGRTAGETALQIAAPPPLATRDVDLYILGAEGEHRAVSLLPTGAEATWDVCVETRVSGAPVSVRFPDLSSVPARLGLTLSDLDAGRTVNMRTSASYAFSAGEGTTVRHLRITAAERRLCTLVISAASACAVPDGVAIGYCLSSAAEVEISVRNIAGRTVATIPVGYQAAGTHTATWSGRSRTGTRVPSGRYLLRITAADTEGNRASVLLPLTR